MANEKKLVKAITARDEDFAQWYTDVVREAELCDYSSVKGCLNYLPNGYAIWENIQKDLDARFKETGVENVSLPMLIPESLLEKEGDHIEGFAYCASSEIFPSFRKDFVSDLHQRHYSVTCGARWFVHIEIYQKYGINGIPCFVGKRQQDLSCVQENSCGRKDIQFMRHTKRLNREHLLC